MPERLSLEPIFPSYQYSACGAGREEQNLQRNFRWLQLEQNSDITLELEDGKVFQKILSGKCQVKKTVNPKKRAVLWT
jgi:hypothetical protein